MDAASWDRMFAAREQLHSPDPNAVVVELVGPLQPGRALDLGAGEGRHAVWLAQHGWQVTAVDFSQVALERTRQRAAAAGLSVECVLADARELRPPANGFDLVLVAYMHPEPDIRSATFVAIAESVTTGGHLLVVGLDLSDASARPHDDWRWTPNLLSDAFPGIELLRCERMTRDETAHATGPAVDTLVWGRRQPPVAR